MKFGDKFEIGLLELTIIAVLVISIVQLLTD